MTTVEIRTAIQDLEQKRSRALEAEQKRLEDESAHRRDIEETNRQLAKLRHEESLLKLENMKAQNGGLVANWENEVQVLEARLNSPDLKVSDLTPAILSAVGNAYNQQQQLASNIGAYSASLSYNDDKRAALVEKYGFAARADMQMEIESKEFAGQQIAYLRSTLHPHDVLAAWINKAPDAAQRNRRIAVMFAITGVFLDPNKNFNPSPAVQLPRQYI